ncbi:LysR substrate-binding domain-containing protein [Vogesella urethralis]|jgi:LysR family glycine cleavage system transcriptional activator|uniref:LysR substrate-binding domain-containing protein n=1 Tax=Vogesella urethralis TaxID=2592656 RepID=UPI001185C556|nr:LysR substrate-binding domain-containing protein [Vogesella urethralis]
MNSLPPLSALRSFEAVARLGSVSRAADELCITHSAVSQQLKLLESQLAISLFSKVGRKLQLSEAGRTYALKVRVTLAELADATRQLQQPLAPQQSLVLAVLPSFAQQWLLPRLPAFRQRFPHYSVTLHASLDIQPLAYGQIDMGIRMGRGGWQGLQQEELLQEQLVVVAAPHFLGGRLPQSPAQIVASPIVHTVESWHGWCQLAQVAEPPAGSLWINDSNLLLAAVLQGEGAALMRYSLVARYLADGRLRQLSPLSVPHPSSLWLVWPQHPQLSRKQADFRDWLHQEMAAYRQSLPAWLARV